MQPFFETFKEYILKAQARIVKSFDEDHVSRQEHKSGVAYIVENNNNVERGCVCVSYLTDIAISDAMLKRLSDKGIEGKTLSICGISLIMHPTDPTIPTCHFNYRYIELKTADDMVWWFGGGIDWTPYVVDRTHFQKFHLDLKEVCDIYHPSMYGDFKEAADEYFYLPHRKEHRGIGGIFFDDFNQHSKYNLNQDQIFEFVKSCVLVFMKNYIPYLQRPSVYTPAQRQWQLTRRSRYCEFNLLHDRGTKFGFNTPNANIENILLSMPPLASWKFKDTADITAREQEVIDIVRTPIDWVALGRPSKFVEATKTQKHATLPVWVATAPQSNYLDSVKNPELASEISVQSLNAAASDGVLVHADSTLVLEALGLTVAAGADGLVVDTVGSTVLGASLGVVAPIPAYVVDTIKSVKSKLARTNTAEVIGVCDGPWTLLNKVMDVNNVDAVKRHQALAVLTDLLVEYLSMQVAAGVNVVQVNEPTGADAMAHPYLKQLNEQLKERHDVVTILSGVDEELHYDMVALPQQTNGLVCYAPADMVSRCEGKLGGLFEASAAICTPIGQVIEKAARQTFVTVGTRSSNLASWQTCHVSALLQSQNTDRYDVHISRNDVSTIGDIRTDCSFQSIQSYGIFVKDIEHQLLLNNVDFAVHSLKDMETYMDPRLELIAVCERDDPADAFLSNLYPSFEDLPPNAVVGTTACRRKAQLSFIRKDVVMKDVRGNVETRMSKLKKTHDDEGFDAIILSYCGVARLGLTGNVNYLKKIDCYHAPGQGVIAIQINKGVQNKEIFQNINHTETYRRVYAERELLHDIEDKPSCEIKLAVKSHIVDDEVIHLDAQYYYSPTVCVSDSMTGHYKEIGHALALKMKTYIKENL